MNAPNFAQFAQQAPAQAPAPQYSAPPPQAPAQPAPWGSPPGAAPQAPPAFAQAPTQYMQQTGPAGGQQYAPAPLSQAAPVGNAFGKGAFAGAAPMTSQLDCAPGTYIFEFVSTGQDKTKDTGALIWRMKYKVVHVFEGAQPLGSEVTDAEFMNDDRQRQYAAAAMLDISTKAMGCTSDQQLKAGLDGCLPPGAADQLRGQLPPGTSPGWSEFADALQSPTQQMSQYFPPNPLAGKRVLARVFKGAPVTKPGKNQGKQYIEFEYAIAPTGA